MAGTCYDRFMTQSQKTGPIEQATNKSWDEWTKFLDSVNAKDMDHRTIADQAFGYMPENISNPGWWAQAVAVAYEQHIGRRLPGQKSNGKFQANLSRTTRLDMKKLIDAWTKFAAEDNEVMTEIEGESRVSGTQKRISWRAKLTGNKDIVVTSEPKANGTASLVLQHTGSETTRQNDQAKNQWAGIVKRFIDQLN